MVNSILFPKEIYNKLSSNENITKYVSNRIYPLVADNNVKYPFIVYQIDNITNDAYTKDGLIIDSVDFTVWVVCDKYITSLEIANEVRDTFDHKKLKTNDYYVTDCYMTAINGTFEENAYLQILSFNCKITN